MSDYVQLFTIIAVFIIVIACINFMNLATARSMKRAKEIGVRKVIGSSRSSLIVQFLGESMLLSLLAMSFTGKITQENSLSVELVGLYWHFVDIVWIVIFTVVYLIP